MLLLMLLLRRRRGRRDGTMLLNWFVEIMVHRMSLNRRGGVTLESMFLNFFSSPTTLYQIKLERLPLAVILA